MHHTKGTCGSQQRSKTFATNTWPSQINKYLKKKKTPTNRIPHAAAESLHATTKKIMNATTKTWHSQITKSK